MFKRHIHFETVPYSCFFASLCFSPSVFYHDYRYFCLKIFWSIICLLNPPESSHKAFDFYFCHNGVFYDTILGLSCFYMPNFSGPNFHLDRKKLSFFSFSPLCLWTTLLLVECISSSCRDFPNKDLISNILLENFWWKENQSLFDALANFLVK